MVRPNVAYTKQVNVPKHSLDPFGGQNQAVQVAKERASLPRRPNVTQLKTTVTDAGDHYVVQFQGLHNQLHEPHASTQGQAHMSKQAKSALRNAPGLDFGFDNTTETLTPQGLNGFDVAGELAAHLSTPQLRAEARRDGFHLDPYATHAELAREFTLHDPLLARQLIGR